MHVGELRRRLRRRVRYHFGFRQRARARRFRELHKGERCFVIGNGPSLNRVDLSYLDQEVTFGVNGIYHKHDAVGFEPTYYIVEDPLYMEQHIDQIRQIDYAVKFFPERHLDLIPHSGEDTYFLLFDWGVYRGDSPHYRQPSFSTDVVRRVGTGHSVSFVALQLAHYMGCDPVYLVGMDHSVVVPPHSEKLGERRYRTEGSDPNHFHPHYRAGQDWYYPDWEVIDEAFGEAREAFARDGRSIYNATVGGKLEIFDRVDFASLFENGTPSPRDGHQRR